MMLAPTLAGGSPKSAMRLHNRVRRKDGIALDATLLLIAIAICGALFLQGGLEAIVGAAAGALVGARQAGGAPAATISGAFAGLWIGVLLAALFHNLLAAALATLT